MNKWFFLILVLWVAACGQVPIDPATVQDETPVTPLLMLPVSFRGAGVEAVLADDLQRVPAGQFYPNFVQAQRFEYERGLISGHVIDYGSAVDVMFQHQTVFGQKSPVRVDNDAPLLSRFNAQFSIAQDGRPTLYMIAGQYVLHVTVAPDPADREIAKFLTLLFAEEVIFLNPEKMTPPPYIVDLSPAAPPVPRWGAVVPSGEDLIMLVALDYTLLHADNGQITFELVRDAPLEIHKKVVDVTRGMGTVAFVDTLRYSTAMPDSGANITATFTLNPPYIDDVRFGTAAFEAGEDIGGGRFSHTAQYRISYRSRK